MKKKSQITQSQRALAGFAHNGHNRIGSNWLSKLRTSPTRAQVEMCGIFAAPRIFAHIAAIGKVRCHAAVRGFRAFRGHSRAIGGHFCGITRLRTANEADPAGEKGREKQMRLSAAICTANIAEARDGDWVLIAPYGEHPSPDGSYVQRFDRGQGDKVVKTWNSVTGLAARIFKNLWHGLGPKTSCPVWDGHPETDKIRWPRAKCLAEITDLRTGDDGLEGRLRWTGNARPGGPLYPSPLWWHWPPSGEPPAVFPELLESVGLVSTPNISSVPAWTQNAGGADPLSNLASESGAENQHTSNIMDKTKIIKLLGLAADATDEQIDTAMKAAGVNASALQTANTAKAELETKLTTANQAAADAQASVTTLTTERDQLKTANATLTAEKDALVKGALDLAEKRGAITPAERPDFQTRLATANTAAAAFTELQTRKAMNTQPVEINGNRVDLSTANSRALALEDAISAAMKAGNLTRDEAFARCQADPKLTALFDAMKNPTRKQG